MKRIVLVLTCASLAADAGYGATRLNPSEKRAMELSPAVVLISVKYQVNGRFQVGDEALTFGPSTIGGTGSGFIYRPDGYIITNGHVVADANMKDPQAQESLKQYINRAVLNGIVLPAFRSRNKTPPSGSLNDMMSAVSLRAYYTKPVLSVFLANGAEYQGIITQYSDPVSSMGKDVAIVKINASNLPTVKLGDSDNVHLQEQITVIGYPGAASNAGISLLSEASRLVPTITNGHVSAVKAMVEQSTVIQSDAVVGHGNSGGPAFNDANEVIGITTFKSNDESGFNFFVPINTAMIFVNQAGVKPEAGLFNQLWTTALDSFDAGKCVDAKKQLQSVLNILPNLPDAQRLMTASEKCIADEGVVGRTFEGTTWIIYGAAGLVIVLLAVVFMARRKPAHAVVMGGAPQVGGAAARPVAQGGTRVEAGPPGLAPGAAVERKFGSVQVTAGSLSGKRFDITKAGLLIGTDPSKCQIVVSEDNISHEHAWIVPVDNSVVVIDRGSTNGTYINSVDSPRVSKVGLQNGDRVYLGKKGSVVLTYFSS